MRKRGSNLNVNIEIHYISESKILQRGSFPLKGRKPEQVALQFWKEIKREMPYAKEIELVRVDGEDITELVKEIIERNNPHL
jgi:hypothetical protein